MRVACACLLGCLIVGCKRPSSSTVATRPDSSGRAASSDAGEAAEPIRTAVTRPLGPESPYCEGKPCRDYAESVERIRQLASPGGGPGCQSAEVGHCGPAARYVSYSDGFGGFEEYFDVEGRLFGAHVFADYDAKGKLIGDVPTCDKTPTSELCDHGTRGDAAFSAAYVTPGSPADVSASAAARALGFPLPAHARGLRTHGAGIPATTRQLRFELPAADLPALEASLPCPLGPESAGQDQDVRVEPNTERWWTPDKSKHHRDCHARTGIHASAVMVDLDRPEQPSVYVLLKDG
jgi:hypothetical protein